MNNKVRYITAGWLIDGANSPILKDILLTVINGTILNISPFNRNDIPDPSLVTNLSHCTIMPPMVDCHVHLALSASTNAEIRKHQLSASYKERKPWITAHIHSLFSHGVLAVRDGGDTFSHVLQYKKESKGNNIKNSFPTLKVTGRAYYRKGRYGSFLGKAVAKEDTLTTVGTEDIESADHIKLINSGLNSTTNFGQETAAQFSVEEIKELVLRVQNRKKKVMIHANGNGPVRAAVEAGCHSIEHGFFMGSENLRHMAEKQIFWVPTVITMKALAAACKSGHLQGNRDVIRRTLDSQLEQIAKARKYGVKMALGTDSGSAGIIHGESIAEELKLVMEAGYPLTEAIQCATSNGAKLLAVNGFGHIAKGQAAHFIAVRSSPETLPEKLSAIEALYISGRAVSKI